MTAAEKCADAVLREMRAKSKLARQGYRAAARLFALAVKR